MEKELPVTTRYTALCRSRCSPEGLTGLPSGGSPFSATDHVGGSIAPGSMSARTSLRLIFCVLVRGIASRITTFTGTS